MTEENITPPAEEQQEVKKRRSFPKRIFRFFAWTIASVFFLVIVLITLVFIYRNDIKRYVVNEVNKHLNTVVYIAPEDIDITIIRTFPEVAVEFKNISALDATDTLKATGKKIKNIPQHRDTLFHAGKISLSFNILDFFKKNYSVHHITMEDASLNMRTNPDGSDNFHFLKTSSDSVKSDTAHVDFALNEITLKNVAFAYSDRKNKNDYEALLNDVSFNGDFSKQNFSFGTDADFVIKKIASGKSDYLDNMPGKLNLDMAINNDAGSFTINSCDLQLSKLHIDVKGSVATSGKNKLLDLSFSGKNVDLPAVLSLLPGAYSARTKDFESKGDFYITANVKGLYGDSVMPAIDAKFGIKDGASVSRKGSDVELKNVALAGTFSNAKGNEGLKISAFKASTAKSNCSGSFSQEGFDHPQYAAKINGRIDLAELQSILKMDTIEKMDGTMNLNFDASGKPAGTKLTAKDFRSFKTSGNVNFVSALVKFKNAKFTDDSINGALDFDGNNVKIAGFTLRAGNSDARLDGSVNNLLGYLFTDEEILDVNANLHSENLDLNTLLASGKNDDHKKQQDTVYRLHLPDRMKLTLNAAVGELRFRRFEASSISGNVNLRENQLDLDSVHFRTMDGNVIGSGSLSEGENDSLLISCAANITKVSINKLFYQFENFGQDSGQEVIGDRNVKGLLTAHISFASTWGSDFTINDKKIYSDADVTIDQGELVGFTPLEALSKYIKLDDLKDIHFQTLSNHFVIRNRIISMPKMDVKSNAMNVTMSGAQDFDYNVDYHFVIDLDELHAKKAKSAKKDNEDFGEEIDDGGHRYRLYLSMKGPIDKAEIHYDRKDAVQAVKDNIKHEAQTVKQILHDEFGWFKNKKQKDNSDSAKANDNSVKLRLQDDKQKKKKKSDDDLYDGGDYN